jgi:radical SAM family uncharacterized protein/radical SAM-linked protein
MAVKNRLVENKLKTFILNHVSKPGRYLGNEIHAIHKNISSVELRFALAYPDIYEIGMSSQAINILYHLLNRIEYVWAERVFAPWIDMEAKMVEHKLPLFSLESFTPLHNFDVIGFTLQYELTYTNLLNMLHLSGIPIMSDKRKENDPFIIAGGPCSFNPEPMADFTDAFYIGDAEEGITELCSLLRDAKRDHVNRNEILIRMSKIQGMYVPSRSSGESGSREQKPGHTSTNKTERVTVTCRITPSLKNEFYPEKPIVPLIEVTHDRLAIEVMRGCTQGCRFCNAGMIYRPVRERSVDQIIEYAKSAMANSGYKECSFLSLSISDYSGLKELFIKGRETFSGKYINFSFPSMRLDNFNQDIVHFAREVRKSGFTFAPETGSIRLRKMINKNITEEDLFHAVDIACQNGWRLFKFYFMIGLPTETKEDVEEIVNLMKKLVRFSRKYGRIKFNLSISPFVPKSHTPFQWEKQDSKEELWGKIKLLRDHFKRMKEVHFSWRDPVISQLECVLGRGDRTLAKVIYSAWEKGAKFDGWNDKFRYNIWLNAFKKNNITMDHYIKEIPEDIPLPWDHIDKGITTHFLKKERKNAYSQVITQDCRKKICNACGIQCKKYFGESRFNENPADTDQTMIQSEPVNHTITNKREALPLRLQYQKRDYARYISHLDLIRLFDRVFRRCGIDLVYTSGFNKRPKMSFSPPLALGYTSEAEYMDIEVNTPPPEDIKERINSILPGGIQVKEIKIVDSHRLSLASVISSAEYSVGLNNQDINTHDINKLIGRDSISIIRKTKDKVKSVDIRPYIESIKRINNKLYIRTKIVNGQTGRVDEILDQLVQRNKELNKNLPIHRTRQLIKIGDSELTPMEV